jgi:hypothetical protein
MDQDLNSDKKLLQPPGRFSDFAAFIPEGSTTNPFHCKRLQRQSQLEIKKISTHASVV